MTTEKRTCTCGPREGCNECRLPAKPTDAWELKEQGYDLREDTAAEIELHELLLGMLGDDKERRAALRRATRFLLDNGVAVNEKVAQLAK